MKQITLRTNELKTSYDYELILDDFDIFRIQNEKRKSDEDSDKDTEDDNYIIIIDNLNFPKKDLKIISTKYSYQSHLLVMMKKNSRNKSLLEEYVKSIYEEDKCKEYSVNKVTEAVFLDPNARYEYFEKNDRLLFDLFKNAVGDSDTFEYSNLTGDLFIPILKTEKDNEDAECKNSRWFLKVEFTPDMCLKVSTVNFLYYKDLEKATKDRFHKDGKAPKRYIIDSNGSFRSALRSDEINNDDYFIKGNIEGKHTSYPALLTDSHSSFLKNSRIGYAYLFLEKLNSKFGRYIHIELTERQVFHVENRDIEDSEYNITDYLKGYSVNIVDKTDQKGVDSTVSCAIIDNMCRAFFQYFGVVINRTTHIEDDCLNLVLLHDKKFYKTRENDPYKKIKENKKTQVITYEKLRNLKYKNAYTDDNGKSHKEKDQFKPIVDKIIKDIHVKADIVAKRITTCDISKQIEEPVSFVSVKKQKKQKHDKKSPPEYDIHFMKMDINPDGKFNLENWNLSDLGILNDEQYKVTQFYQKIDETNNQYRYGGEVVEGLFYKKNDMNSLSAIIRTNIVSYPYCEVLDEKLKEKKESERATFTERDCDVWAEEFISSLDDSKDVLKWWENRNSEKTLQLLTAKKEKKGKKFSPMDYLRIVYKTSSRGVGDKFANWIKENKNLSVKFSCKSSESSSETGIANLLDISFYKENDIGGKKVLCYIAGETGLTKGNFKGLTTPFFDGSITNFSHVRKIISNDEAFFEDIKGMLYSSYVRVTPVTVLFWPYKYLREYQHFLENTGVVKTEEDENDKNNPLAEPVF